MKELVQQALRKAKLVSASSVSVSVSEPELSKPSEPKQLKPSKRTSRQGTINGKPRRFWLKESNGKVLYRFTTHAHQRWGLRFSCEDLELEFRKSIPFGTIKESESRISPCGAVFVYDLLRCSGTLKVMVVKTVITTEQALDSIALALRRGKIGGDPTG